MTLKFVVANSTLVAYNNIPEVVYNAFAIALAATDVAVEIMAVLIQPPLASLIWLWEILVLVVK